MGDLMSFSAYAAACGLNVSTVSRAVSRGRIPTVVGPGGKRLIDRQSADGARRRDSNLQAGHGGRPDRALRKASQWRAKSSTGYDPAALALLRVIVAEFPQLMKEAMAILGADEINAVRAVLALEELASSLACCAHNDLNAGGVHDYRTPLPDRPVLQWSSEAQAFIAKVGDDGSGGRWVSDDDIGLPGGTEWAERSISACWGAKS